MKSVCALICSLLVIAMSLHARERVRVERDERGSISLSNGLVRLSLQNGTRGYDEEYFAWRESWHLLLRSGNPLRAEPALKSDGRVVPLGFTEVKMLEQSEKRAAISLTAAGGGHVVRKTISLESGQPFFQVIVRDSVTGVMELAYLLSTYSYVPEGKSYVDYGPVDFVWTPQLRPDSDDVIADHTFRSPALMVQKGPLFAALIPDVNRIQPWRSVQTSADLQISAPEAPLISYGAMNWRTRSHVFYTHSDKMTTQLIDSRFEYGFYLYLSAGAGERVGFRDVVRFHWETQGRKNLLTGRSPQAEPFSAYIRKAWSEYMPSVAYDTVYRDTPVTLLSQKRLSWSNKLPAAANRDSWFTVWFNSLRTAYGMYLHGKSSGDADLMKRATRVLNVALLAPDRDGISPSVFYIDSSGGHWVADHGWGGIRGGRFYSVFNNAWTQYWLLEWADILPEREAELLRRARKFADFLLVHQKPSGVIPSWFDAETLAPADTFQTENAETAGAAFFLAELYARTRETKYLNAAERAMEYIQTEIVPQRKWFDFETFFSCSRKPIDFYDPFTGQYPQNTLSIHQAAEACLSLYNSTGKELYRLLGLELIDYLSLYQQVWSPRWLSRPLFGGFGAQNTDGEWSDARQGYFAVTLVKYFDLTGDKEYLERGVAALRAMFSLFEDPDSPRTAENYSHSAIDRLEGVTGLHWGTGSSTVSIHTIRANHGDAFVNIREQWGVGIDGCTIPSVQTVGNRVTLVVNDFLHSPRKVMVKFAGIERDAYGLVVNENSVGTFSRQELRKGVEIDL